MKRHGGTSDAYHSVKEACMVCTLKHSARGRTMGTMKR